jgi:uncharacterized protein (DUF1800 family)
MAREEVQAIVAMGEALAVDTLSQAITTNRPLAVRLFDFFSNHFSVSTGPTPMRGLAATLEREAIGPHLGGRFVDMLLAVERHPAMLTYLNNAQSTGPGSRLGRRGARGLNENLAREILELHTLGVDGGYAQTDVRELAMAITGWSIGMPRRGEEPGFLFRVATHEPGERRVLGRRYASEGVAQGERILRDLTRHPSTQQHLCVKLARHMVADNPPPALVTAMTERWRETDGSIPEVVRTSEWSSAASDSRSRRTIRSRTACDIVLPVTRRMVKNTAPRAYTTLVATRFASRTAKTAPTANSAEPIPKPYPMRDRERHSGVTPAI